MKKKFSGLMLMTLLAALFTGCSHSSSSKGTGSEGNNLPKTKWLVLMYMDGDNNLNDVIYCDLNEVEKGLAENPDKDDASNIKVVALWDGWDFQSNNDSGETSVFETNSGFTNYDVHNLASTRLLELAPDDRYFNANGGGYYDAFELSPFTVDLTDTVDWLDGGEANMALESTLESFLKWAKAHYNAENIILQFSNHGGGPRSASINGGNYGRRSMCWDETSGGSTFLKTSDVSKALTAAGYGRANKVKMIMEDVCLGGSLEEAYQLKDFAEYYVASPNNVPGLGFDYISFISSLTSTADIESAGRALVDSYKGHYTKTEDYWENLLAANTDYFAGMDDVYISLYTTSCSTLSFIDLRKIDDVENAVEELASFILTEGRSKSDSRIVYSPTTGYYHDSATETLPEDAYNVAAEFGIKYWTAFSGEPIYYQGTFGNLKDLGFMLYLMDTIYQDSWPELLTKTAEVRNALNAAIIACWRDGYNGIPTYYKNGTNTGGYLPAAYGMGLTINCCVWVPYTYGGSTYRTSGFAEWYANELAFGRDCASWTTLIQEWFPFTGN